MTTINEAMEYIIPKTLELTGVFIPNKKIKINYSAIFCQSEEEYKTLTKEAAQLGKIAEDTPTGPLYKLKSTIKTPAGPLRLLKIRKPDPSRPQRGDADFTLGDYKTFKGNHAGNTEHFRIIDRGTFEMIELRDPKFDVLAYFSNPPLTTQFGIK